MDSVKKLINENSIYYEHLEYYFRIIKASELHLSEEPDISIESCKSLIEGICKYILSTLEVNYDDKKVSGLDFQPLANMTLKKLSEYDERIDDRNFISQTLKFVKVLGETRNTRGDISHGKCASVVEDSTPELALFVLNMTKAVLTYILDIFFAIENKELEKEIMYEDNPEFNDMLDEEVELGGKLLYSKALFEQDPIEYIDRLEMYEESKVE